MLVSLPLLVWMVAAPRPDVAWCDARMRQMAGVVALERFEPMEIEPALRGPTLAPDGSPPSLAELADAAGTDLLWMEGYCGGDHGDVYICKVGRPPPSIGVTVANASASVGDWPSASQELAFVIRQNPDHPEVARWNLYLAEVLILDGNLASGLWALEQASKASKPTDTALRSEIGLVAGWAAAHAYVEARWAGTPGARAQAQIIAREALRAAWWLPVSHPARVCPDLL
ncbi:MAG: hypothetical protein H6739_37555 [Alphaproteobacteria bacterium]|nr:hypothetical protein [Alphaproteobacteria bacterium]